MTEIPSKTQNLWVIGIWGLGIIWNLGFVDWNLIRFMKEIFRTANA